MSDSGSDDTRMTGFEMRAAGSLGAIFALRMLGLFMIYPVFATYARDLQGATPFTIGLALGGYGFTQALLQIPFGFLSDRFGRKRIIALGLVIFGIGSVVAALGESIHVVILGRVLQGGGAIGSVVLAFLADLTRDANRTKAMGLVGISLGASVMIALVTGPVLAGWIGLSGLFWLTAALAALGLVVTGALVPNPVRATRHLDAGAMPEFFKSVLTDSSLLRLDFGILALHAMLTASFLALPHILVETLGVAAPDHWQIYLPVMVASLFIMVPGIILGERYRRLKLVFTAAIGAILISQTALLTGYRDPVLVLAGLVVFFGGFNLLEATLPSLISKIAPVRAKGTAIGVYSSSQFLGIFLGGTLGGWLYGALGLTGLFAFTAAIALVWLAVAMTMPPLPYYGSRTIPVGDLDRDAAARLATRLNSLPGVVEAVIFREDGMAHLKVDRSAFDDAVLTGIPETSPTADPGHPGDESAAATHPLPDGRRFSI